MPRILWWILEELFISALLSPSPSHITENHYAEDDSYYEESYIAEPEGINYEDPDLLKIEPEMYISRFFMSEAPLQLTDIDGVFTGLYNGETYTFIIYPDKGESIDTTYFYYRMLNMESKVSTPLRDGVMISSQNKFVIDWRQDELLEGQIFKVENVEDKRVYVLFGVKGAKEKLLFYKSPIPKTTKLPLFEMPSNNTMLDSTKQRKNGFPPY